MVQRQDPAGTQPGLLQEGLGSSLGQGRAAGKFPPPGLRVRSEDQPVEARRHLLFHAPPVLRPRRQQDAVALRGRPGDVIHIIPGSNPAETALSEVFVPPEGAWSPRGIDMDLNGVVWTPLASGHIASFDRRKCRGPQNGPGAASGKLCPEGWALYRMPGPQFKGVDQSGSANHAYYIWVDRYNTLGLGANVPIASANGAESLLAVVDGKMVDLRVPYPLGFNTKLVDGRIDDPNAGWKGKGLWTMSGTRTVFHNEGGTQNSPKVYKIQIRPDPLAN